MNRNVNRDLSLDILRVLACLMVFGVHLGQHVKIPGIIGVFFSKGSTGVSFFFILSGYLAYVSLERLHNKYTSDTKVMVVFWIKKILRILPLYYLVIIFYIVFFHFVGTVPADDTNLYWFRYLLFVNSFIRSDHVFWTNLGAVWSVSCFFFFYLICPLCYKMIRSYWMGWIAVIASYGLLKYIDSNDIYNLPLRWLFYFFLGILIFLACREHKEIHMVSILLFVSLFCVLTNYGTAIISSLIAAVFILCTRIVDTGYKQNIIGRCIGFISMISYSIYLIHAVVIEVMDIVGNLQGIAYTVVLIACTSFLSVLSYLGIEKRMGSYLIKKTIGTTK
ncbi:MAG: acyltransferase [Butyrivibrio sp.]|nr:acyltransferase [Butyrivibrio sp.]